jgi:cellulose synthase/poly-beta-1,6-N-acetylglucosamine synthase-like glycosyltransferase
VVVSLGVFWFAFVAVAYAYVGYPAILWLASRVRAPARRSYGEMTDWPTVTMIVSAYNEEEVIGDKIRNALSLDYPAGLLKIIVVSDGSTDKTPQIAREFADQGVTLRHYEGRIGKTACLNRVLPLVASDIVVFSDANSIYGGHALRALVLPFVDGTVGFVTGWTTYKSAEGVRGSLGLYSKLELMTKELESQLMSCIGADGAIFAIRRELYVSLKDYDINDLVLPLSINERGYRGVLQRDAICAERDAGGSKGEFQRQVRITSRTIRAIANYRQLLNPFRFGFLSFELLSHKAFRLFVPFFMVALLVSNLLLAAHGGFYLLALTAQSIFYSLAAIGVLIPTNGPLGRVVETARTFIVVNAAIGLAWIKYMQGETFVTWSPTRR